jgi:RNA polymerase sigma-70 factor (ECF subfamily)
MSPDPSTSAETDSVVDLVRRGNATALETLFAAHREYLRRVIDLRMNDDLRRRVDPSDIVQEAQLEALRRVAEYARDPQLSVRLWMRQIAIDRLGMAHRRHIKAEKRSVLRELRAPDKSAMALARQLIAGGESPSRQLDRDELVRLVRHAIDGLGDADREIIVLQAFEGLNSSESAQVLGIEPAAARKRYGRALLRIRRLLDESGVGDAQP